MPSINLIADIVGYAGSTLIILAYFLLQNGKVNATSIAYPLINLIGALMLMFSLSIHVNMPSIVIEIFWIAISLYGLKKALSK